MRVEPVLDLMPNFVNGYAWVRIDDKWGVMDADYKMVMHEHLAEEGSGRIILGSKVVDLSQHKVDNYDSIEPVDNHYIISRAGKVGVMDADGVEVVAPEWDEVRYREGRALHEVRGGVKWGFVDDTGKTIVGCRYDTTMGFDGLDVALVSSGGKWGIIGSSGQELAPCKYDHIEPFSEELAMVVSLSLIHI